MPYRLEELELEELSLVDDPASPGASVVLAKRHNIAKQEREDMTDEQKKRLKELMEEKGMSEDEARAQMAKEFDDMTKRNDEELAVLQGQVAALTKALEATGATVAIADGKVEIGKAADSDYVEIEGERVLKSSIPSAILKRMERQDRELQALAKAAEMRELDERAEKEIPNLSGTAGDRRALLKAVDGIADEKSRENVLKMLSTASRLAKSGGLRELGHTGADDTDGDAAEIGKRAAASLDDLATKYATEHGVTFEKAYRAVCSTPEGRKLFAQTRN